MLIEHVVLLNVAKLLVKPKFAAMVSPSFISYFEWYNRRCRSVSQVYGDAAPVKGEHYHVQTLW